MILIDLCIETIIFLGHPRIKGVHTMLQNELMIWWIDILQMKTFLKITIKKDLARINIININIIVIFIF